MPQRPLHLALCCILAVSASAPAADEHDGFEYSVWREFWSFKPVTKPQPPAVKDKAWVKNPIDAFILAKLEASNIKPAPRADKHTLIRRATFDLTGLPPTVAEIEAFINDDAPDAYERLIRRLLDSPHYGERYGRHWLDAVRYEQGKVKLPGVKNTRGELEFRDYIVRAFNKDKPYNQLITEHLAGDLLPSPPETNDPEQYFDQITAPAFLSIGNWFDECTDPNRLRLDIVDEQINAVSKAFLGLTISCARCHDHKFDPITAKDYYALAGVFASTRIVDTFNENWKDGRVRLTREMAMPEEVAENERIRERIAATRAKEWEALKVIHAKRMRVWKEREPRYRAIAAKLPKLSIHVFEAEDFAGQSNLKVTPLESEGAELEVLEAQTPGEQWVKYEVSAPSAGKYIFEGLYAAGEPSPVVVQVGGVAAKDPVLTTDTGGWDWSHRAWGSLGVLELREGVNTIRIGTSEGRFPMIDRIRWYPKDEYDKVVTALLEPILDGKQANEANDALDLRELLIPAQMLLSPDAPFPTVAELASDRPRSSEDVIRRPNWMVKTYDRLIAAVDYDKPTDLPVHLGGDTYRVSKMKVPRGVPVLFEHAVKPPVMPADRSGRLELARWLTDANHPLTARVMANRLWQWHLGRGIVDTPNDFGSRGSPPSHPQLLDWLAATFVEQGWSMKKLHYFIMTSSTYMQESEVRRQETGNRRQETGGQGASGDNPQSAIRDPQSLRLLAHFPRRRLEVEAIYDAMLATTGKVPRQPSGGALDFSKSADRMMYVLTANRSPVGLGAEVRKMFPVFDYDPTGEPIGKRDSSTTAAQALFWLNNPIPKHFAGEFARQLLTLDKLTDAQRLDRACLTGLGRKPDAATAAAMLEYLGSCEKDGLTREEAWKQVCLAIYASNAFRYLE